LEITHLSLPFVAVARLFLMTDSAAVDWYKAKKYKQAYLKRHCA